LNPRCHEDFLRAKNVENWPSSWRIHCQAGLRRRCSPEVQRDFSPYAALRCHQFTNSKRTAPVRKPSRRVLICLSRAASHWNLPEVRGNTQVRAPVLIAVGTLMLAGDDDPITPLANARLMTYLIPNARLHVTKGVHTPRYSRAPPKSRQLSSLSPRTRGR
jgi:pimeloyl-ACP methyl ester carboxylesterase